MVRRYFPVVEIEGSSPSGVVSFFENSGYSEIIAIIFAFSSDVQFCSFYHVPSNSHYYTCVRYNSARFLFSAFGLSINIVLF
jgi:hypothetical protein